MTWQRIDDDIYIDDTLVTCAEYQLFIDEMREQGKYYQPDHWTSYQFPEGQAQKPILGARYSDAEAFCKWLDIQSNDEWYFRLPIHSDGIARLENSTTSIYSGYWVRGIDGNHEFSWNGIVASNARAFDFDQDLGTRLSPVAKLMQPPGEDLDMAIELETIRALSQRKNRPLDLDKISLLGIDLFRGAHEDRFLNQVMAHALEKVLYKQGEARKDDFEVFVEIFTLQERIAGRSPAFEGIRLVKERIKK